MGLEHNAHAHKQQQTNKKNTAEESPKPPYVHLLKFKRYPMLLCQPKNFIYISSQSVWSHSEHVTPFKVSVKLVSLWSGNASPGLRSFIVLPNRLRLFLWFHSRACMNWNANKENQHLFFFFSPPKSYRQRVCNNYLNRPQRYFAGLEALVSKSKCPRNVLNSNGDVADIHHDTNITHGTSN